jgi:hypothetical protein
MNPTPMESVTAVDADDVDNRWRQHHASAQSAPTVGLNDGILKLPHDTHQKQKKNDRKVRFRDRTRYKRVYTRERMKPLQSQLWFSQDEIRVHERREQAILAGLIIVPSANDASRTPMYEEEGLVATIEEELCLFGLESLQQKKRKHQRIRYYRRFVRTQGGGNSESSEDDVKDQHEPREEMSLEMLQLVSAEHVRSSALAAFERGLAQARSVSELCNNDLMSEMQAQVKPSAGHQRSLSPLEAILPRSLTPNEYFAQAASHPPTVVEKLGKESHTIHPSGLARAGEDSVLPWTDDPPSDEFSLGGVINDSKDNRSRQLKQTHPVEHPMDTSPHPPPRKTRRHSTDRADSASERPGDMATDEVL